MAAYLKRSAFRKIFILMRKNFLLRKYHYIHSAFEIIIPTLLFAILVVLWNESGAGRSNIPRQESYEFPAQTPPSVSYLDGFCKSWKQWDMEIGYTNVPDNEDATQVRASNLSKHIMESVTETVNKYLVPCCNKDDNSSFRSSRYLSKLP